MKEESKGRLPVRAFDTDRFWWNLHRVPPTLELDGKTVPHPGRTCAIFVVHGIGEQKWTQTAATLRSGFEDALDAVDRWQARKGVGGTRAQEIPPPHVHEGFWANYALLQETFPEDWKRFSDDEARFFGELWKIRVVSPLRTYAWLLRQQVRLLDPRVFLKNPLAWLLYIPLQLVSFFLLTAALIRHPRLLTAYLRDARLYLDPRGNIERAIVQRIDWQIGQAFLHMVGLDWQFRPLPPAERMKVSGEEVAFDRVVWVAHSLGTVISYNVLSDLFHKADEVAASGDEEQRQGVARFRACLRRFISLGSPLDKVAFLFKDSLRPWPQKDRSELLTGGDATARGSEELREWWINFYHVLDPVSGALSAQLICGKRPPGNLHMASGVIPGWAHVAYWTDLRTLRFILGRTYGKEYLHDRQVRPWPAWRLTILAFVGYLVWAGLLCGGAYVIIRWAMDWVGWGARGM